MNQRLDEALLAELEEIMEDEFSLLLETFLSESAAQWQAMRTGWQANDLELLHGRAHALKGSCANVGAARCAELCRDIEQAASTGTGEPIAAILKALEAELHAVQAELASRL
jgi:HPt (histidine-containing phosphotransfer) domain-containing protein